GLGRGDHGWVSGSPSAAPGCGSCAGRDAVIAEQARAIKELTAANARLAERVAQLERMVGTVNLVACLVAGRIAGLLAARWRGWAGGGRGAVLQGVSFPGGDHQPLCLALPPLSAELPRDRGDDAGPGNRPQPRDGPAVVCQVRADLRQRLASSSTP